MKLDFVKLAFVLGKQSVRSSPSLRLRNQRHRVLTTHEKQAERITKQKKDRGREREKKRGNKLFFFQVTR